MKYSVAALLLSLSAVLPATAEKMIPAGSILQCTVSEPKISSKTLDRGDPVLCRLSHLEYYGRSVFPYGSYLEGRFEDYKDPGHLVGKGWMELKFDRLVISQTDEVIPITAKVVEVPKSKYPVDKEGRIHGSGHATRDTIEWLIPVLWPIDLINLPRRGPTPVLKAETRLTLKVMDDFGVPTKQEIQQEQQPQGPALIPRTSYEAPVERQAAPVQQSYAAPVQQYAPAPQTVIYNYAPPQQQVQYVQVPVRVPYPVAAYPPPPPYAYRYAPRVYAGGYYGY